MPRPVYRMSLLYKLPSRTRGRVEPPRCGRRVPGAALLCLRSAAASAGALASAAVPRVSLPASASAASPATASRAAPARPSGKLSRRATVAGRSPPSSPRRPSAPPPSSPPPPPPSPPLSPSQPTSPRKNAATHGSSSWSQCHDAPNAARAPSASRDDDGDGDGDDEPEHEHERWLRLAAAAERRLPRLRRVRAVVVARSNEIRLGQRSNGDRSDERTAIDRRASEIGTDGDRARSKLDRGSSSSSALSRMILARRETCRPTARRSRFLHRSRASHLELLLERAVERREEAAQCRVVRPRVADERRLESAAGRRAVTPGRQEPNPFAARHLSISSHLERVG